jgi:hypothetical protein
LKAPQQALLDGLLFATRRKNHEESPAFDAAVRNVASRSPRTCRSTAR